MMVAGEASGDRHAANVFLELKKHLHGVRGIGMGGAKMAAAGVDIRYDSSNIGVIGLVEALKHYGEIHHALKLMQHILKTERPDLLICVDYKEFNFKLARFAKRIGIKVLFYVGPQVWAWRPGRAKKYGEVIDMMAVIFPFEIPYYEVHNIPARYVGHPSVDKVHPVHTIEEDIERFQLNRQHPVVGLMPGSRKMEIKCMLPVMLQAAERILEVFPDAQFVLPQADSISDAQIEPYLDQFNITVKVFKNQPYDVIQCCDVVMTMSGTATLEVALMAVPMVIACIISPVTYWIGKQLVKSAYIGLPNIVVGKAIVRELIQHQATAESLSTEIIKILTDQAYAEQMHKELKQVKQKLGHGGGSKVMAELVEAILTQK
jgi:lipid-A-disaccharide synthase